MSTHSSDAVVSLENVEVHFEQSSSFLSSLFGDQGTVQAVDQVSLDIHENDVIALVGESGCGRS